MWKHASIEDKAHYEKLAIADQTRHQGQQEEYERTGRFTPDAEEERLAKVRADARDGVNASNKAKQQKAKEKKAADEQAKREEKAAKKAGSTVKREVGESPIINIKQEEQEVKQEVVKQEQVKQENMKPEVKDEPVPPYQAAPQAPEAAEVARVEMQRLLVESEDNFKAEAAYERLVWAPEHTSGGGAQENAFDSTGASGAVCFEQVVTSKLDVADAEEHKAISDEELMANARELNMNEIIAIAQRIPFLQLLLSHRNSLAITARTKPLVDDVGGQQCWRLGAVVLTVQARLLPAVLYSEKIRHHESKRLSSTGFGNRCHELDDAVSVLIRAKAAARHDVVAFALKTDGVCLCPRAARMPVNQLRSLSGLLSAMETEGTASTPITQPHGLASSVTLRAYQLETLSFMLSRERSPFGMEDLFETRLGDSVASTLPEADKGYGAGPVRSMRRDAPREKVAFTLRPPPPSSL
jgi:hypothetical protein